MKELVLALFFLTLLKSHNFISAVTFNSFIRSIFCVFTIIIIIIVTYGHVVSIYNLNSFRETFNYKFLSKVDPI